MFTSVVRAIAHSPNQSIKENHILSSSNNTVDAPSSRIIRVSVPCSFRPL
jgi:hypothetical protein